MQNKENLLFGFIYGNLKEILKFRFDFSFIKMNYSNMRVFGLYCQSELVKEVTSFKLETGVDVNFECSVRIRKGEPLLIIFNYNEYIISKNYFSLTWYYLKAYHSSRFCIHSEVRCHNISTIYFSLPYSKVNGCEWNWV